MSRYAGTEGSHVISSSVVFEGAYSIGCYSVVGAQEVDQTKGCRLGAGISIGSFCVLQDGITAGSNCTIDHYCAIYSDVAIGNNVRILYGAKLYSHCIIGDNCIVGSDIPERVVLESDVTFMGAIAHSYRSPHLDWDEQVEPSPLIKRGSVIGLKALLIGGIVVGENCYVAAGEVLRHNLPDNSVFLNGQVFPLEYFRGLIKVRKKYPR